tara:strand:+ start:122 stop:601 length:480 start_codon:yes stop_codon:yes gene_type:complete
VARLWSGPEILKKVGANTLGAVPTIAAPISRYNRFQYTQIVTGVNVVTRIAETQLACDLLIVVAQSNNVGNIHLWRESIDADANAGFSLDPGDSAVISVDNRRWDIADCLTQLASAWGWIPPATANPVSKEGILASEWFISDSTGSNNLSVIFGFGAEL